MSVILRYVMCSAVVSIGAGVLVGRWTAPSLPAPSRTLTPVSVVEQRDPATCPASVPAPAPAPTIDRAMLRSEIAAALAAARDEDDRRKALEEEAEKQASDPVAYSKGEQVVETAIATGRWTRTDRTKLYEQFASLTRDERVTLLKRVSQAVNSDKLTLDL